MTPSYVIESFGYRDSVSIVKNYIHDLGSTDTILLDTWDMYSIQSFCSEFQNIPERETIILHLHMISLRKLNIKQGNTK